jgi:hypothetical protein
VLYCILERERERENWKILREREIEQTAQ